MGDDSLEPMSSTETKTDAGVGLLGDSIVTMSLEYYHELKLLLLAACLGHAGQGSIPIND